MDRKGNQRMNTDLSTKGTKHTKGEARVRASLYPAMTKKVCCLKRREEVLQCVWAGKGTKEIGAELGISPKTVEYHRAKLYELFGVHDLVSLCRRAIAVGLIELGEANKSEQKTKGDRRERLKAEG